MKAWIENEKIRDIAHGDPFDIYHPDVAILYDTEVPDNAVNGDEWINGELIKRVYIEPELSILDPLLDRFIDSSTVREKLTFAEKTKWDNDLTHEIVTAKCEFAPRLKILEATEVLQFLVDSGSISQESMDKILA